MLTLPQRNISCMLLTLSLIFPVFFLLSFYYLIVVSFFVHSTPTPHNTHHTTLFSSFAFVDTQQQSDYRNSMSSITASYSTMQMTRVAIFSLVLGGGIAYLFLTNKKAKEKAAKEKAASEKKAKEKRAEEIKIATKLGVAVDKIVSKSLFCFCSFFVLHFLPYGFVLLTFLS